MLRHLTTILHTRKAVHVNNGNEIKVSEDSCSFYELF